MFPKRTYSVDTQFPMFLSLATFLCLLPSCSAPQLLQAQLLRAFGPLASSCVPHDVCARVQHKKGGDGAAQAHQQGSAVRCHCSQPAASSLHRALPQEGLRVLGGAGRGMEPILVPPLCISQVMRERQGPASRPCLLPVCLAPVRASGRRCM